MNETNLNDIVEEIELKDLEQRIEFGCCGSDPGTGGGGGSGGVGNGPCNDNPAACVPE